MSSMEGLLDDLLSQAADIDSGLLIAESLGWHIHTVRAEGGSYFVMLEGRIGQCVNMHWSRPEIRTLPRYSNATFRSFYGAIMLALVRGLAWERQMEVNVGQFTQTERG